MRAELLQMRIDDTDVTYTQRTLVAVAYHAAAVWHSVVPWAVWYVTRHDPVRQH